MPKHVSIVDVEAMSELRQAGAVVLDARSMRQRGLRFLSGAVRVLWTDTCAGGQRCGLLAEPSVVAERFAGLGVCWARPVVVVGAGASGWGEGARVAWSLAWLNHPAVHWLPLFGPPPKGRSGKSIKPSTGWDGTVRDELRAPNGTDIPDGSVVVDVRSPTEQAGARRYGEARGGHIPGARFVTMESLWSASGMTHPDRVRALAVNAGIPLDGDLVCVCTGGVRSAAAALMLEAAAVGRTIRNHDGGMWAWSADRSRPMQCRPSLGSKPS